MTRKRNLSTQITRINIPPTPRPPITTVLTMSQLAQKNPSGETPPLSAQPTVAGVGPQVTRATIAQGSPRGSGTVTPSIGSTLSTRESILAAHLDITPSLQKAVHSVVKARNGSVLSRGTILKTDHYPSGEHFYGTGKRKEGYRSSSPLHYQR